MVSNNKKIAARSMCEKLDDVARARLVARAALFGIHARIEPDKVHLVLADQGLQLSLSLEVGLSRLVAELAEVLTPWVIFSPGKPPEKVLLQYTDVKYRKLVAAWQASKN
jgi:hypothetical protein